VWRVVNAHCNFVNDKTERKATTIIFETCREGNGAQIRLTHRGVVPHTEGYSGRSGMRTFAGKAA